MSYNENSWGKRYILMLHRCLLAQTGGNWLKLAKTKWLGIKKLRKTNNFLHFYFIDYFNCSRHIYCLCLHSSVVSVLAFKSKGPGFKSQSIQVIFFCIFLVWKGEGSNPGHFFPKKMHLYHNFITIYEFFTSFGTYSNNNLNGCIKVMRKSKFSQGELSTNVCDRIKNEVIATSI